MIADDYMLMIL